MRPAALAAAILAVATAASAQMPKWTPPSPDARAVQAGTYAVEPEHTRVQFSVLHMGFTQYWGDFAHASGSLTLDPKRPAAASFDITVPVSSVSTTNGKLTEELVSKQFFDADQFPTIRFKSTRVVPTGPRKADVTGDLTLHGVTRPVTLHVTFNAAGVAPMVNRYTAGFDAEGMLRRSDFGVNYGIPIVGDEVKIKVSAAFERK